MTESVNHFARLKRDQRIRARREERAVFSYLSWPYAVTQLRLADPSACWEVRRF
jgi:hypothetical protein